MTASDVQRVDLTVDAVDLPETTVQLAADGSVWTGLLSQLRAGTGRRFRAFAYDSNARLIYQGEATEVTITANQTVQVNILLQQVDPSPAFENAGPLITALVVSRSSVEVGGFVDVQATARDPNTGDVLTFSWTATAGSFNTPTALGSRWTAPLTEGVQTLTLMVADQLGASTSVSFPIQVEGTGVGEAEVFVRFNSWPEVIALSGFPTQVVPGQSIGVSVHATDNDDVQASLHYAWTASCAGTWTDEGSASAHFTPTELPAQNTCDNCQLTVRVTDGRGGEGLGHLGVCVGAPVSPNVAPRITSAFQTARTVGPGNTVRFNVRAVDPEGTALSFAWEAPVGSLAVPVPLGDGSEVAWTAPACVDARSTPVVRVRVTDAEGLEALQAFSLTWNGPACATTLGFLTQPTDRLATQTLAPAVQVVLMDSLGRTSLAPSGPVRLEVGANPGGATLSGTVEVAPVSGIATFADLSLNASGVGYTLVASVPGLPSAVSQAFTIHPLAIQGASLNHYLTTGNAMATQGSDLGSSVIQALVEQPNGTFMTFSGTGAVDGTFSIEGVPSGLYYLRLGTDYVVTSSRAPDLGRDGQGRPDAIPANTSTFLAVDFQGLAPWKSGDSIEVFSQGTGLWTSSVSALGPTGTSPVVGAHQWAQPLKYWQMRNAHLVDAASGDVATFHQLSRKTDGSLPAEPFTYSAASRAYSAPLAIAQGATASMSGMMSVLPQDQALMVDVRAQAFESLRTAVNPGAQAAVSHSLYVAAFPDGTRGSYAAAPDLVTFQPPAGGRDRIFSFTYGNPHPDFVQAGMVETSYLVQHTLPGGAARALSIRPSVGYVDALPAFSATALVPHLSPARTPTLNGQDAFGTLAGVGLMPRLAWMQPAVGTATHYRIRVYEIFVDAQGRTAQVADPVAQFYTARTDIRFPPGVLVEGRRYFAILEARANGNADFQGHPFRSAWPEAHAMLVTGVFAP
ncbi:hypothetical protein OV207_18265 [Corallococcus sp. BB11-1]|uniref:hypothetical protein n=1 Tax=Corallococcus sp. BB11-1 TaxID=2996783 RepID=UPI0022715193|nr:hypothetical protein [Corallococcus sp. BB11-1]MCY1033404.1 hypothetical protein [Corallococcus sp. BB11-1]